MTTAPGAPPGSGSDGEPDEGPPDPLEVVTIQLEEHVDSDGWDQPPRLFALVTVAELVGAAPEVAAAMGLDTDDDADALAGIEQDALPEGPLDEVLAGVAWGPEVAGCALVHEVVVLPPGTEDERPEGVDLVTWASEHPQRRDVRMVVSVLRDGERASLLRVRADEEGDDVIVAGPELAPNLADALAATLFD